MAANLWLAILQATGQVVQTAQEISDFLAADPSTLSLPEIPLQAAGRGVCQLWSGGLESGLANPLVRVPSALALDTFCGDYLGQNGWSLPETNEGIPPTGGQCPTQYRVRWSAVLRNPCTGGTTPTGTQTSVLMGPIGGMRAIGTVSCPGGTPSGFQSLQILAASGWATISTGGNSYEEFGIISVERTDGLADDCGNAPPYLPGSNPAPAPTSGPIDTPRGPVNINFDPSGGPGGGFTVCLDSVCFTVDPPGYGPGGEGGDPPGFRGNPGSDVPIGPGGGGGEGGDPSRRLLGIRVQLSEFWPGARLEAGPPEPLYLTAGWVSFTNAEGGHEMATSRIVRSDQFFTAPKWSTGWQTKFSSGYTGVVTPYYETED